MISRPVESSTCEMMPRPTFRATRSIALALLSALASACGGGDAPTGGSGAEPDGLPVPVLPATLLSYRDAANPLPAHFTAVTPDGSVASADNSPGTNPITDAGATLGRALFYDVRLSVNNTVSCGSCHLQAFGFADTARVSRGFAGGTTARHSMMLANGRFYARGRFFWNERAASLEDQVLQPIQDPVEMGLSLDALEQKLARTRTYPPLFRAAFGASDITRTTIARALAQFVRSMTSFGSRFDQAFQGTAAPNFPAVLTPEEVEGERLFRVEGECARCHVGHAQIATQPRNIGLDLVPADTGVGGGRFKVPSLRNVGVRTRFMHDGRFTTLRQVVDFYADSVRASAGLDPFMREPGGAPKRLALSDAERNALVAFMRTLTDQGFLTDPRFSDPFRP